MNPSVTRRAFTASLAELCIYRTAAQSIVKPRPGVFDVHEYGAKGDGRQLDSKAIQAAVESAAHANGGTVLLSGGVFRSGTIRLRSRVKLHITQGATLLGSIELADYPSIVPALRSYADNYTERSLIYAERCTNIGIEGSGTIDGQGASFSGPYKTRPYLIRFVECGNVNVRDVQMRNSAMWVQHYLACENVRISGLSVQSRVNRNNDGIDIDSCRAVRISDCDVVSGDDSIVLKSTTTLACRDVVITNCVLSSLCNAFKLGTESNGGFQNIVFNNCSIYDTNIAGIALESVDGGALDRVLVSNVAMREVKCPLFIRLGNRARTIAAGMPVPHVGALRNVRIEGVQSSGGAATGSSITGLAGHLIENIVLRDIFLSFAGGGTQADATRAVPERPEAYPEYNMFGTLPAYGLYCRHVSGLQLFNVHCSTESADMRPSIVFNDVRDLRMDGNSLPNRS